MQRHQLVVAIDGPSGSGKSTVAKAVATRLGLRYLDTGAMYRALTWLALQRQVPLDDATALARLAGEARLDVDPDAASFRISADGVDVTAAVRRDNVTSAVSAVSAVTAVREAMVARQREIIGGGGIVVEGRDIGTTVVPDAPVKVFLTADPDIRALRRVRQDGRTGAEAGVRLTAQALARRDAADSSRAASPLSQAADAIAIDSTELGVDAVVTAVVERAAALTAP